MRHIERNQSVVETSGDISNIHAGKNNTISLYALQIIGVFTNRTNILLLVIPDCLFGIGVIANVLLIYYIFYHKRYHSSIFALIVCLSLCDLCTCSTAIFADNVFYSLAKPGYLCPLAIICFYTSFMATSYYLVAIAVIRFYQLGFPLSARAHVTPSLCFKISFIIWILAMAYAIPFASYYLWVVVTYKDTILTMCFYTGHPALRETTMTILMFALPTILIVIFHGAKHCRVSQQNVSSQLESSTLGQESKRQTTDTRAVVTVITFAIFSNLSSLIHRSMHGIFLVPYFLSHIYINWIFDHISFANSIINPFVYAFASPSVRADLKEMFKSKPTCV